MLWWPTSSKTEMALGAPRVSPRTLRWALDQYFISRPLQDLTNPEQLVTSLESYLKRTVYEELFRQSDDKFLLRRQVKQLRFGRLTPLLQKLAKKEDGLSDLMRVWKNIIGWLVGILTLRWEQRF